MGLATAFGVDDAGEEGGVDVVLLAGGGEELGDVGDRCGGWCRDGLRRWLRWGVGEGFDAGDGLAGEVDEVGGLRG